jgi:hypothetical protein
VPVMEIYHFGNQFLNGYTPQKMQAVRGYFDQVFEGGYSKSIPADKRAAILKSADARYTEETGKKPNREDILWKTLRNVEASEKYPDLWTQFRDDLNSADNGVMQTVVGSKDPNLGSNALNRPDQKPPLNIPTHTGHRPEQVDTESKGFDLDSAPKVPNDTAHRDQEKPDVTNVFQSTNRIRGEGVDLDTTLGDLRRPADPGVKPWEQVNGQIIRNPELQILQPGQQAQPLEKGKKYIWAIDKEGNLRIGIEAEVAPGKRLGHPTLLEDGKARVGGEIKFNEQTKEWRINDESGRYSRGRENKERNQILENVKSIFGEANLDVGVKYLPVK